MPRYISSSLLILIFIFYMPTLCMAQNSNNTWTAPEETASYVNPLEHNDRIVKAGMKIFSQLCAVCHGKKGLGDGITAASLEPKPADLSSDLVQGQDEGAIFWKIYEGRPPMPGFKNQLSEKQVWALVVYIKSLEK